MKKKQMVSPTVSIPAPLHPREEERIARLLGYDILDTGEDPLLDHLTKMAAQVTGTPISLVSLVDRNRQWIKSHYGLALKESAREDSFCGHTILEPQGGALIVNDALGDGRFVGNRFVTGEPHIRFYAGIPLESGDGLPIGSLCVIDTKPNSLTEEQIKALHSLAAIVMDYISVHRSNRELTKLLLREKEVYNRLLTMSAEMVTKPHSLESTLQSLMNHLDPNLGWLSCRITNFLKNDACLLRMNPLYPKDPEIDRLWHKVDTNSLKKPLEASKIEFISAGTMQPEYAHLIVPISVKGRQVAVIEMIYPDHRRADSRIKEVFELMAVNLAALAEREILNTDLRYQAEHDALTGAVNRTFFIDELGRAISEVDELRPNSALLYLDLDGFKEVNDNFSHQTGDRLLIEVTERLRSLCRQNDLLGRLSGDEFVLLIRNVNLSEDLETLIMRIQRNINHSYMLGDLEIRIGASIGVAILDKRNLSTTQLIRRSEEAMYLVKRGERRGYCIADAEIIKSFKDRIDLDHRIHEAVFKKRLLLHFQPIVELSSGQICSAEALLRVIDQDGTILNASDFIDSLKRIRLMPEVDEWVIAESIRLLHQHVGQLSSIPDFCFSVNVSPAILTSLNYASLTLNRIKATGIPPTMLRIEIIENHLDITNPSLIQNIDLFKSAGVQIAIDNYGTGYSNLYHLTSIPFDTLKIDKMFLKGIRSGDMKNRDLLGAIINLGTNLGHPVIAEGVENQEEVDQLLTLGCKYGQGYFYGKPMPIDKFIDYVKKHSPQVLEFPIPSGRSSALVTNLHSNSPVPI